jgi:hypothetical protein
MQIDSSVCIDYLNGATNSETDLLDGLLDVEPVAIGDLILTEALQRFRTGGGHIINAHWTPSPGASRTVFSRDSI